MDKRLRQVIEQLCEYTAQQERLSSAACDAATECFDPKWIQLSFIRCLNELVE
jgi:hypothetical protein